MKASKIFSVAYEIIKPINREKTKNGFKIYGQNSEEWKKELLIYIDADQLPACNGGNLAKLPILMETPIVSPRYIYCPYLPFLQTNKRHHLF